MTSELDRDILVTAPPNAGGARIDRFLATALEDDAALDAPLSRTRIKALIQSGALFEAGAPQLDPSANVRADIEYRLVLPPVRDATPQGQDIPLDILFEDCLLYTSPSPRDS